MESRVSRSMCRAGLVGVWFGLVCLGGCQFGTDLSGYTHGDDASSDVRDGASDAGRGGAGGSFGAGGRGGGQDGGGAGGQDGGGGGGGCGDGRLRCVAGILQQLCADGEWTIKQDCIRDDMLCDGFANACVSKCRGNEDCLNPDEVTGQYCRADGRCASKVFETVWEIKAEDLTLKLPYYLGAEASAPCEFTVLWGDEGTDTDFSKGTKVTSCQDEAQIRHTYRSPGRYSVKVLGIYEGWGQDASVRCEASVLRKLRKVVSFGPVGLRPGAFACTLGLEFPLGDVPDASKWWDASRMFYKSDTNSEVIGKWHTSGVGIMAHMFEGAYAFNQPLDGWDTSSVSSMARMFMNASSFNQSLKEWDTSNVSNMESMFEGAAAFNQPIGDWHTAKVRTMERMFASASAFNQPIGGWNTSRVRTMSSMFSHADAFNQPIGGWNISNVTDLSFMFFEAKAFNQPLDRWDTSHVVWMANVFSRASAFNQPLGSWNTSKVRSMSGMFYEASSFNQPLGTWDTSNVESMWAMFAKASTFNQPLGSWKTSNVSSMAGMFRSAAAFDQNLAAWSMKEGVKLQGIFRDSGISKGNYCLLVNLPVWRDKSASELGVSYKCSSS